MREKPPQQRPAAGRFIGCLNVLLVRLQRIPGQNVDWDRLQKAFRWNTVWMTVRVIVRLIVVAPRPPAPPAEPEGADLLFLQKAVGEVIPCQRDWLFR